MDSAQQELMIALLSAIYSQGLLPKTTYMKAVNLVHFPLDSPPLFRYPASLTKEAGQV